MYSKATKMLSQQLEILSEYGSPSVNFKGATSSIPPFVYEDVNGSSKSKVRKCIIKVVLLVGTLRNTVKILYYHGLNFFTI